MNSILVDVTKCTGCEKCVDACIKANGLDKNKADYDRAVSKDGLSDNRLLSIIELENGRFGRKSCMHCQEPACVAACLVGGIKKEENGAVVYDADKCIGCRYCMLSCPYHIPRYEWSKSVPFMKKCNMCIEKISSGEKPACVGACPSNAIVFGQREDLLKKAKSKIRKNPGKYIDHIWGENEFGGASLLYISDIPLDKLDMAKAKKEPILEITEPLIEKTPLIGMGVAASLVGFNWFTGRKNKIAALKKQKQLGQKEKRRAK